ncbi:N-acetylglucosamine-6-phosphate deacetylase [Paenibacillus solanacearum]|uniref:N-acetylglucosamine-6-phosphate deacetylase n=1 Tax=Paenibacillus solanacearum TaxID=2048548 RepID=A0A916NPR9_9BACL|nr:amidohydrolase family protein [Paenibacillus solanacearum]CAG7623431.1 N-acetylglucosamine-6-phosphate deacetylase [Paenibacillus solanacearum]
MGERDRSMSRDHWIEGRHYRTGEPVAVRIAGGVVAEIIKPELERPEADLPWLAPGLTDLQINGYRGRDFNTLPFDEEMVRDITRELWAEGVTSYFPTVITNAPEAIREAVATIARACSRYAEVAGCIAGIHVEGPFISPEDGPRGAHDRSFVRPPDWDLFRRWQEAAEGRIKIITVSPEWAEAPDFIEKCADSGVTVSIGHTKATSEQIRDAVRAGARLSTHLGNGAHPVLPRHPNYIWDQLAEDALSACLIADGFHLPPAFIRTALRVKGDKAMLVSDAVSLSGMPPGTYETNIGGKVVKSPEGKLHLAEQPAILAGSAQMLLWGIERLVAGGLCSLPGAWDMASIRPASFMNLPQAGGLAEGAPADLVLFRREGDRLVLEQTYKRGDAML